MSFSDQIERAMEYLWSFVSEESYVIKDRELFFNMLYSYIANTARLMEQKGQWSQGQLAYTKDQLKELQGDPRYTEKGIKGVPQV